jgi:molybdenum cofactor guanylyltransferase
MPKSLEFRPAAYILAGGKSSRFGSDKARVRIHGQPNLSRLASAMSGSGWSVTAVAQEAGAYEDLGLRTIADFEPNAGPLAGVITALEDFRDRGRASEQATGIGSTAARASSSGWALIVNCDLILWREAWSQTLLRGTALGVWISVLSSTDFVPFPGLYSPALLPSARERWRAGTRSMKGLFEAVADRWSAVDGPQAAEAEAKREGTEWRLPRSYNTPEELERALAALEEGGSPRHS